MLPAAPSEHDQFRMLYRKFATGIVDLELLSSRGDIGKLLGQLTAILAAFSLTVAMFFAPRFATSQIVREKLKVHAWNDVEFLISSTIVIAGLFSVLAWNAVLPDRRDCLVLGLLPLRTRTILSAKVAAIGTSLGIAIVATNIFTGVCYPFIVASPPGGFLAVCRAFASLWIAVAVAGLFVCCGLLAVQGIAAQLLPRSLFLRFSGLLQIAALFLIVGMYFLEPPVPTDPGLRLSFVQTRFAWMPTFWFFGLFQAMNGSSDPAFTRFAGRAALSFAAVVAGAALSFAMAYGLSLRRIVEQPDIAPGDRSQVSRGLTSFIARRILTPPLTRAVLLFIARTCARSRQHRLMLAAYGGLGLAMTLIYAKDLLYGRMRSIWDPVNFNPRSSGIAWNQVNMPMLVTSMVLLAFAIIGVRAVFALPITLPANWVFRITAVHTSPEYFSAVRRSLYALTALPIWIASAIFYPLVWPLAPAIEHLAVLFVIGILLIEISLHGFRKVPFACSYLPGKANIHVKLGIWAILFLFVTDRGVAIEFWAMERAGRFAVFIGILLVLAIWARVRTTELASSAYNQLQFEDLPPAAVDPLVLLRENA